MSLEPEGALLEVSNADRAVRLGLQEAVVLRILLEERDVGVLEA